MKDLTTHSLKGLADPQQDLRWRMSRGGEMHLRHNRLEQMTDKWLSSFGLILHMAVMNGYVFIQILGMLHGPLAHLSPAFSCLRRRKAARHCRSGKVCGAGVENAHKQKSL